MTDLPYPPPYQDIVTLAAHLCVHENTIDNWVRSGTLPPPRNVGGKRLWSWKQVCEAIEGPRDNSNINLLERITNATRKAAGQTDHKRRVRKRDPDVSGVVEVPGPCSGDPEKLPTPADVG